MVKLAATHLVGKSRVAREKEGKPDLERKEGVEGRFRFGFLQPMLNCTKRCATHFSKTTGAGFEVLISRQFVLQDGVGMFFVPGNFGHMPAQLPQTVAICFPSKYPFGICSIMIPFTTSKQHLY